MYNRSKSLLILIVCVLSIFFVQQMSYAHQDHSAIEDAKDDVDTEAKYMGMVVGSYNQLYGTMETLISEFEDNEKAIKKGNQAALSGNCCGSCFCCCCCFCYCRIRWGTCPCSCPRRLFCLFSPARRRDGRFC